jgi:hypothetical protein
MPRTKKNKKAGLMTAEEDEEAGPEPPAWGTSRAKEILLDDIRNGIWKRGDPPTSVWLSREEFQVYKQRNFGTNFRAACDQLVAAQGRAKTDADAVAHDLQLHPRPTSSLHGYPHWQNSRAEALLNVDIDGGKLDFMTPSALRETREEYLAFPLPVFTGHIQQERRKRIEGEYWKQYHLNRKLKKQGLL